MNLLVPNNEDGMFNMLLTYGELGTGELWVLGLR